MVVNTSALIQVYLAAAARQGAGEENFSCPSNLGGDGHGVCGVGIRWGDNGIDCAEYLKNYLPNIVIEEIDHWLKKCEDIHGS